MKRKILLLTVMMCLCLTACGRNTEYIEQNENPTISAEISQIAPAETTQTRIQLTKNTVSRKTESAASSSSTTRTGTTSSASAVSQSASAAETKESAATQAADSEARTEKSENAAVRIDKNALFGKWETVSFSISTGESTAYDLSDPVQRSYYVGLELRSSGESTLITGTDSYPATIAVNGNTLSVWKTDSGEGIYFQVSDDGKRMTVELVEGMIIATLKRTDKHSITKYQASAAENECPYAASDLTGEWAAPKQDGLFRDNMTVTADGSVIMRYQAGEIRRGKLKIEQEARSGGSCDYYYAVCDENGNAWLRFPCVATPVNHLYSEQAYSMELTRISLEEIAVEKMDNFTFLMCLMSGGGGVGRVKTDPEKTVKVAAEEGDYDLVYNLITDEKIGFRELRRLLDETISGTELKSWHDSYDHSIIERDGQEYILSNQGHGYFIFSTERGVTITDQTETSFTATTIDFDMLNGYGSAHFVFDGTRWTIESN